jgi:5-methylcytosine-specific restriction protein A
MSLVQTKEDFENKLLEKLRKAQEKNQSYVDITSGDLHRSVGGYPGKDHRMPVCCDVMRELMKVKDEIIQQPPSGMGATLVIRYHLPRL